MLAIYKKELHNYFITFTGYIFLGFFVLITAFYFSIINVTSGNKYFTQTLLYTVSFFLMLIPVLTMRLFSEETRQKTDQLLFTSPLSVTQIVMGKFLAAASLFTMATLITVLFPVSLSFFTDSMPVAEIAGCYVGYLLMGFCFISVGLLISVLTNNQIAAAVGTFAAIFFLTMLESIATIVPATTTSSVIFIMAIVVLIALVLYNSTKNAIIPIILIILGIAVVLGIYKYDSVLLDGLIGKVLNSFSISSRFSNFSNGVFNVSDVVYYISFITAFIYLSINTIEKRKWQ